MTQKEFITRSEAIKSRLYRTAFMYLGGEHDALDALDEAVYRGFRNYRKLRQDSFFETWITRILINVCHDELRRRSREQAVADLPEMPQEHFDTLPLKQAIVALPEELRAVVILRYFSGFTLEETAAALDIPRGTVSSRQKRALGLLRLDLIEEQEVST